MTEPEWLHTIPVVPVAAPRQTRRDSWKPSPAVQRYRSFKDAVMQHLREQRLNPSTLLPDSMLLVFNLPVPPSWSHRKKQAHIARPHRQKPDIDNLTKALLDTLYGSQNSQSKGDQHHWDVRAIKLWTGERNGSIEIWRIPPFTGLDLSD